MSSGELVSVQPNELRFPCNANFPVLPVFPRINFSGFRFSLSRYCFFPSVLGLFAFVFGWNSGLKYYFLMFLVPFGLRRWSWTEETDLVLPPIDESDGSLCGIQGARLIFLVPFLSHDFFHFSLVGCFRSWVAVLFPVNKKFLLNCAGFDCLGQDDQSKEILRSAQHWHRLAAFYLRCRRYDHFYIRLLLDFLVVCGLNCLEVSGLFFWCL